VRPPASILASTVVERRCYGSHAAQFGELRLPSGPGPHPVAIVIHGGFWRAMYSLEHIGDLCDAFTTQGIATWSLEYRRLGQSGGGWPGTLQDVAQGAAALEALAGEFPLNLQRVAPIGHSAGGHLALWLAAHAAAARADEGATRLPFRLAGAVSLAGVVDLRVAAQMGLGRGAVAELLGGSLAEVPERYACASPRDRLPLGIRQFLVHGEADDNVPIEISRAYCRAAAAAGDDARLTALPHTGHFEVIDPTSHAWPPVLAALVCALEP
jgi:acetyl esterase/lipase